MEDGGQVGDQPFVNHYAWFPVQGFDLDLLNIVGLTQLAR